MADSEHSSSEESLTAFQDVSSKKTGTELSKDEEALVIRMYNLVGKRWSLIAGRIPGRTADDIEKYWYSREKYCQQVNEVSRNREILQLETGKIQILP